MQTEKQIPFKYTQTKPGSNEMVPELPEVEIKYSNILQIIMDFRKNSSEWSFHRVNLKEH